MEKTEDDKPIIKCERNYVTYGKDVERRIEELANYPTFNMFTEFTIIKLKTL